MTVNATQIVILVLVLEAIIIPVCFAVVMSILFIHARKDARDYRNRINSILDKFQAKNEQVEKELNDLKNKKSTVTKQKVGFRITSGNPRFFKCRDESV